MYWQMTGLVATAPGRERASNYWSRGCCPALRRLPARLAYPAESASGVMPVARDGRTEP